MEYLKVHCRTGKSLVLCCRSKGLFRRLADSPTMWQVLHVLSKCTLHNLAQLQRRSHYLRTPHSFPAKRRKTVRCGESMSWLAISKRSKSTVPLMVCVLRSFAGYTHSWLPCRDHRSSTTIARPQIVPVT